MKLKPNIHENGIDYTLSGDCYLPELRLPEDNRPIGRWGRLHREYLKTYRLSFINHCFCPGSCIPSWLTWTIRPPNGAA